jgi:hypothetical protein
MDSEVERIMKYLVEDGAVLKLLRILERHENYNYALSEGDSGTSYYSRKYKTWVLHNNCFQLN